MTAPESRNINSDNANNALPDFLKAGTSSRFLGRSKRFWAMAGATSLVVLLAVAFSGGGKGQAGQYLTEEAATGNLVVSISASGTLAPTRSVDVGSELSGTLEAVLANENDKVTKGQIVARLDTAKLRDAVAKSQAALDAAAATVAQTEATLGEARANLDRLRHVAELSGGKVPSKTELDSAEAVWRRAVANLASARASVSQAKATLQTDQTNIEKAVIRSPINGVVLTRKVEPGQTVAAQMTTPVLFTIAEDLTKMELQVKVDEADVSNVQLGQPASFAVSAWPGRSFPATIQRVGLGSTTTDNVVTYKTVLTVTNDDLALRPGMTATARIITAKRDDVLLVPNAALRFSPPNGPEAGPQGGIISRLMPRPPMPKKQAPKAQADNKQIWVLRDGQPVPVPVQTGASNGRQTEITGGALKAGMAVIVDYQEKAK
ncbi:efflux RND transporter periplasmic adaptor subunit [Propionivibrio limicola]|uniref:efflux RND transporter periplasmic adaptor subunit n=1 Tax=Propionivibrio limicola TaxID=167645 RepID=UPI001290B93B|nr:efflux RND transporter periplasmic adaptor subunit [Propionivibrio limicola]